MLKEKYLPTRLEPSLTQKPDIITSNSDIYLFEEANQRYALKIFHPTSRHLTEMGGDIDQKLDQFNKISKLVRFFYGYQVLESKFFLCHSRETHQPTIGLVRNFISGIPLNTLQPSNGVWIDGYSKKLFWDDLWHELTHHPDYLELHPHTQRSYLFPDFSLGNIIYQPPDRYTIIDW